MSAGVHKMKTFSIVRTVRLVVHNFVTIERPGGMQGQGGQLTWSYRVLQCGIEEGRVVV